MTNTTETQTGPTTEPEAAGLELPNQLIPLLGADRCVIVATGLNGHAGTFGWAGLEKGNLGLSSLEGQALILLAQAKVSEAMVAMKTWEMMDERAAAAKRAKAGGLVVPGR